MRKTPAMIALVALAAATAAARAETFTDFEDINTSVGEAFTVGAAPESATLSGDGFSGVAGIGELYFSGVRAWMINPEGEGLIKFEENAYQVSFWTRLRTGANGSSVYTAYNDAGAVLDSITIDTPGAFQKLEFTGSIDRIVIQNNAVGGTNMNSIDNLAFTAVPEPGSLALALGTIVASLSTLRTRRFF